jgi:hypothetical protein
MTEMCGEGRRWPFATPSPQAVFDEVTIPALLRGMERSGRQRTDFQLSCPIFVVTGESEEQLIAGAVGTRKQIAFYGSTPAYRKVLELHGWGDLHTALHQLSLQGEWDQMGSLIDDEILEAFAVVAPIDTVASKIRDRCDGVIDRVLVVSPPLLRRHRHRRAGGAARPTHESPVTAPTMDEAAKVLADPLAYADEPKLPCGPGTSAGERSGVMGRGAVLPSVLAITKPPTSWQSSATTHCSPIRHGRCL